MGIQTNGAMFFMLIKQILHYVNNAQISMVTSFCEQNSWCFDPHHAFDHQSPPAGVLYCREEDRVSLAQSQLCPAMSGKQVAIHHNSKGF